MSQHHTPEQAAEILARELYVSEAAAMGFDGTGRRGHWYQLLTDESRGNYRRQAEALITSLAESDLAIAWVLDKT